MQVQGAFPVLDEDHWPKTGSGVLRRRALSSLQEARALVGGVPSGLGAGNLPGYSDQGRRFEGEWDAEKNPTRETAKLWFKFLQSNNNFPGGGAPALEHGAPSLADYKDWVGKAQK
jgi:hypothetical protein